MSWKAASSLLLIAVYYTLGVNWVYFMQVYGYARVSNVEQSEEFDALKQQIARLEKAGAETVLVDVESGRSDSRKNFNELLKQVERGKVREVIITRIDRLGRSTMTLGKTLQIFEKYNVKLRILDAPVDPTSPFGWLSVNQMSGMAEFESRLLSQRISHGMDYFRNQGKIYRAPFGYKLIDKKLVVDEEQKIIAREIIEMMVNNQGIKTISKYLWDNHQIKFSVAGIRYWIKNPMLLGHTTYLRDKIKNKNRTPIIIPNTHEALLTESELTRIKANLLRKTKSSDKNAEALTKHTRRNYPLKGLLRCAVCQGGMHRIITKRSTGTEYITCNRAVKGLHFCNNTKCARLPYIIEQVIDLIAKESTRLTNIVENDSITNELESLIVKDLKTQLAGMVALKSTNPAIITAITDIKNQIQVEEYRRKEYPGIKCSDERKKILWTLSQAIFWEEFGNNELQAILVEVIESVFIDASGVVSVKFLS